MNMFFIFFLSLCMVILLYCFLGLILAFRRIDIGPPAIYEFFAEKYYIRHPHKITPKMIQSASPLKARRLFEACGFDRYIKANTVTVLRNFDYAIMWNYNIYCMEDDIGTLYFFTYHFRQEGVYVVKVKNSTPEPDGTYKDYYIRVSPRFADSYRMTPKTAVAWSFGLNPNQYKPRIES